ncbi:MAG: hypothetical protein O3A01_05905 [bacterium]|nr:hypothetical protein [bacterium]
MALPSVALPVYQYDYAETTAGIDLSSISRLAMDPAGQVYVMGSNKEHLARFSADGSSVDDFVISPALSAVPQSIVATNDAVYMVGAASIFKVPVATGIPESDTIQTGQANIVVGADGNLHVTKGSNYLRFDLDIATLEGPISFGSPASKGVAIDGSGNLFYYGAVQKRFYALTILEGAGSSVEYTDVLSDPVGTGTNKGVAATAEGGLYIGDQLGGLYKYDSEGTLLWNFGSTSGDSDLSGILHFIVSPSGNIVVLTDGGGIKVFAPIESVSGFLEFRGLRPGEYW